MGSVEDMRILLLAGPIPQDSGVASHLLCLAKQLSDRGHQVALATRLMGREEGQRIPSTLYFSQFNDYLKYYYLLSPNLGLGNQFAERIRNLKLILNSFRDIKNIIQDYKPDVIHSHSFSISLKLNLIEIKNPTPFMTNLHQDIQVSRSRFEKNFPYIFQYIFRK
jgi:UDP-N-acetylglucosamine:LPS N-acetylglucosamine transferase